MKRKPRYLSEGAKYQRHLVVTGLRRLEEVEQREGAKRLETLSAWKGLFDSMADRGTRYSEKSQRRLMEGRIKPDGYEAETGHEPEPLLDIKKPRRTFAEILRAALDAYMAKEGK